MAKSELIETLNFTRGRTIGMLDTIAKMPDPRAVLAYRPGPGRASIAWQLMHLGATDDRHLTARMAVTAGDPKNPEFVKRFAGGSTPDDDTPSLDVIRDYLNERRQALLSHLASIAEDSLDKKPNEQSPWTYREWMRVLVWHEAHHHGQAHLSLNMYKAK